MLSPDNIGTQHDRLSEKYDFEKALLQKCWERRWLPTASDGFTIGMGVTMVFRPLGKLFRRHDVDCKETRQLSSDYLEDNLTPSKFAAIRAHLSNCGPCRAFVDTLGSTIGILSRLPTASAPASFKQSLMERIKRGG